VRRLYIDELTFERVMDIIEVVNPHVSSSPPATDPHNLAWPRPQNVPILGTSAKDIDGAEGPCPFSSMLTATASTSPSGAR
jgi:carbamoyl-phosphate synthase large subunit